MSKKSKDKPKGKAKASDLKIHKDTVQSLSDDDLGKVQGGVLGQATFKICIPLLTVKSCARK